MLFNQTPIGMVQVPEWLEKELVSLTDDELLQKGLAEVKHFCVSPATYAMIEKRHLERAFQQLVNPNVGFSHETARILDSSKQAH